MEVRQFHAWFLPSSALSYVAGFAAGLLLVVRYDMAVYAYLVSFTVKYVVEGCMFLAVLAAKGG